MNRTLILLVLSIVIVVAVFSFTTFSKPQDEPPPAAQSSPSSAAASSSDNGNHNDDGKQTPSFNGGVKLFTHSPEGGDGSPDSTFQPHHLLPSVSGGVVWRELGRAGWVRPTRQRQETHMTCAAVTEDINAVYAAAARNNNNFKSRPNFGMPWFFHEPYPVCGAILLRHLHGSVDNAPVLRISSTPSSARRKTQAESALVSSSSSSSSSFSLERDLKQIFGNMDLSAADSSSSGRSEMVDVVAGEENSALVSIEDCGERRGYSQLMYTARLVSLNFIAAAHISPRDQESSARSFNRKVSFVAPAPGLFVLEVKLVHANGTSDNPTMPKSLGVVGIRANINNRKAFMYNEKCDFQRHVAGSPLLVRAHASEASLSSSLSSLLASTSDPVPLCTRADYKFGFWARISNPRLCGRKAGNPYCAGDSEWVSDASAYNTQYVWVPSERHFPLVPACKYTYWSPPQGPARSCLRHGDGSRSFLYLVGDSVMREYAKSCELLSLRSAMLQCLYANIRLEGQHFSNSYAESVAKVIVTNIRENNAGIFASNLGLQHMIGPCTTKQWRIFVRYFVLFWKQQIVWAESAAPKPSDGGNKEDDAPIDGEAIRLSPSEKQQPRSADEKLEQFYFAPKYLKSRSDRPKLELAVWIGPPQIQYARKGMGAERAALWDEIAWQELEPLGFQRMRSIPPTQARQEGTWDGLHYASERNKVQTEWRNKEARVYKWQGGVANVLMTMLLNLICQRPAG